MPHIDIHVSHTTIIGHKNCAVQDIMAAQRTWSNECITITPNSAGSIHRWDHLEDKELILQGIFSCVNVVAQAASHLSDLLYRWSTRWHGATGPAPTEKATKDEVEDFKMQKDEVTPGKVSQWVDHLFKILMEQLLQIFF